MLIQSRLCLINKYQAIPQQTKASYPGDYLHISLQNYPQQQQLSTSLPHIYPGFLLFLLFFCGGSIIGHHNNPINKYIAVKNHAHKYIYKYSSETGK